MKNNAHRRCAARNNIIELLILFLSLLSCGFLSIYLGKELCWDLANYHFYNPFAFLNTRNQFDYWPDSNIHQFINPTMDLLSYFLIQTFTPRMAEFILGAIHGINLWLLFLISRIFLRNNVLALLLAVIGLYGPTVFSGIGSFQNDNLASIFVLAFIFLQLKSPNDHRYFFAASLLLGAGFGLKLTTGIYFASAIITTVILEKNKVKLLTTLVAGTLIGMLITSGYWMFLMWQQHGNPLFPFFDGSTLTWRDTRFLPKTIWETLFYPFYFSFDGRTSDSPFIDFRFSILYLLFVIFAIQLLIKKIKNIPLIQTWLFIFFIFSYIIWQYYFSIARYIAPLEMLAPLVIYLLIENMINNQVVRYATITAVLTGIIYSLIPIYGIRAPWYDKTFFNIKFPPTIANTEKATVLIAYSAYALTLDPRPQSYLIPYFPKAWNFIGIPMSKEKYLLNETTIKNIQTRIVDISHPIYLLTSDRNMPELYRAASLFGYKQDGQCEKIFSDRQAITHQQTLLCLVKRTPSPCRTGLIVDT